MSGTELDPIVIDIYKNYSIQASDYGGADYVWFKYTTGTRGHWHDDQWTHINTKVWDWDLGGQRELIESASAIGILCDIAGDSTIIVGNDRSWGWVGSSSATNSARVRTLSLRATGNTRLDPLFGYVKRGTTNVGIVMRYAGENGEEYHCDIRPAISAGQPKMCYGIPIFIRSTGKLGDMDDDLAIWENQEITIQVPTSTGNCVMRFYNLPFAAKSTPPTPPVQNVYVNIPPPVMNSRLSFTDQ